MATQYTLDQIGARVRQRNPASFNGFTDAQIGERVVARNPQMQALVAPATTQMPQEGVRGVAGVGVGALKQVLDSPRQFAESGFNLGQMMKPASSFVGKQILKPLINLLPGKAQETIGSTARDAKKVLETGVQQSEMLERKGSAEKTGSTIAEVAQLFTPGGLVKRGSQALQATKGIQSLGKLGAPVSRGIAEGVSSGIMTLGQSGGDIKQAAGAGAADLALNVGLGGAGRAVKGLTSGLNLRLPGSGVDEVVEAAAQRTGTKLPASSLTNNKMTQLLEQNAAQGIFGKKFKDTVDNAVQSINDYAQSLTSRAGSVITPTEVGQDLLGKVDEFKRGFIEMKEQLYDQIQLPKAPASTSFGYAPSSASNAGSGLVDAQKTLKFAEDILSGKERAAQVLGSSRDIDSFRNIVASIKNGTIEFENMRSAIRELNGRLLSSTDPVVTGNRAALERLAATMTEDFEKSLRKVAPDTYTMLMRANSAYKKGLSKLQSPGGTKIARNIERPENIYKAISSPATSVTELKQLMSFAGNRIDDIRATLIDDIITQSSRDGEIRGTVLETVLRKYGKEKLGVLFTPQQIQGLEDLSEVSKALSRGQKVAEGSQTAFSQRVFAMALGVVTNPILAIKLIAGDALLGKALLSEQGQKALLKGINMAPLGNLTDKVTSKTAPFLGKLGAGAVNATSSQD